MNSMFFVIITIALIILQPQSITSLYDKQTGPEIINKACSRSPNKNLCLSVFKKSNESTIMDLQALAFFALQEVSANASATTLRIKTFMDDKTIETPLFDSLDMCSKTYIDAVEQLKDTVNAIVSTAYHDALTWMNAVIDDIKTCDDAVKGKPGKGEEISKRNHVVTLLCRNALSVVEVLLEK
ncbi:uncharacterized protein LOC124929909 [Impatiens glandulifera]|uniref:uncharacterized protein LOC124929909 n=1 Tax=Impatiens glandulifera TaxID=253017 RepID=UPI001FB05BD9|nr:uncharacterized protein LOC124929909 [Impatiens glandulifera]